VIDTLGFHMDKIHVARHVLKLSSDLRKANKEIARLRAALEHISMHFGSAEQCREMASWALEEQDD